MTTCLWVNAGGKCSSIPAARRTMPAMAYAFICIRLVILALVAAGRLGDAAAQTPDPLPSWNDGPVKKSITDFVPRVTTPGGAEFVPVDQRIATFDNDGTLWAEQPMYFQIISPWSG
jgi:hypothetical protein